MDVGLPRNKRTIAGLCLAFVAACALEQTATPPEPKQVPAAAPTIDGRRDACLLGPFVPEDASTLADGTSVAPSDERRSWTLTLNPSATGASRDELRLGAGRLRSEPGLERLHRGNCDVVGSCFAVSVSLCTDTLDEVVTKVRRAVDDDPVLADRSIPLQVEFLGRLGPRCEADDPECAPVPEPHGGGGFYDPTGRRASLPSDGVGTCEQDGDCLVTGCHQQMCSAWELGSELKFQCLLGISPVGCSGAADGPHCKNPCRTFDNGGGPINSAMCDTQRSPSRVFCGCVDKQCVWFDQD